MNLSALERRVHTTVKRADLQGEYKGFINEALAEVQRRWNWGSMENSDELTILVGESKVRMPDDYKELMSRNVSPIMLKNSDTAADVPRFFPVDIRTESEIRRLNSKHVGFSSGLSFPIWVSNEDDVEFIEIDASAGEDLVFRVKYYRNFPPLDGDDDINPITKKFPRMIYSYARFLAFESVNDPLQLKHEQNFEKEYKSNKGADVGKRYRGRNLRM